MMSTGKIPRATGDTAMTISTFDTHAAVTALRDAGIDEAHAAAIVNTVRDASVDHAEFATKADLDRGIGALRSEMRWMFGFQAALILAIAAKLFGIV